MQEKRIQRPQPTDQELYKKSLKRYIKRERRADNLDRLLEIQAQKKTWKITFLFCLFLNLALITMGLIGTFN